MRTNFQGSNPLTWPESWERKRPRHNAAFRTRFAEALYKLQHELALLEACDIVLSTNVPLRLDGIPKADAKIPHDCGIAVYFTLHGKKSVLACDAWDLPEHNVLAIAKHVEALRGQERWGVGSLDRAFTGYAALPAKGETSASRPPWRTVLGFAPDELVTEDILRTRFRDLIARAHPDLQGGNQTLFLSLTAARDEAVRELRPATLSPRT